jgi:hypothetical protein
MLREGKQREEPLSDVEMDARAVRRALADCLAVEAPQPALRHQ